MKDADTQVPAATSRATEGLFVKALHRVLIAGVLVLSVACQPSRKTIDAVEFHAIGPLIVLSPSAWVEDNKIHVQWQLKTNARCSFSVLWGDRQFEDPGAPDLFLAGYNEMDLYVEHPSEAYRVVIICDVLSGGDI